MHQVMKEVLCLALVILGGTCLGGSDGGARAFVRFEEQIDGLYWKGWLKKGVAGIEGVRAAESNELVSATGALNVPSEIRGCPVTTIGWDAFRACGNFTEITLPRSVQIIGKRAFARCTNLERINLPQGLKILSDGAFQDCHALKSIEIPAGVTCLGESVFSGCCALVEVRLPAGLSDVGCEAFAECRSLKRVVLPEKLKEWGFMFRGCSSLEDVVIPQGCESFKRGDHCVIRRKDAALVFVFGVEGSYRVPDGVSQIGTYAFAACPNLTEVVVPASVRTVPTEAFDAHPILSMRCALRKVRFESHTTVLVPPSVVEDEMRRQGRECPFREWTVSFP